MHTPAFEIVNRVLGWGDPKNGIWFVGLEEATCFKEDDVRDYVSRDEIQPVSEEERKKWRRPGKQIRDYTAKIVIPLSLKFRRKESEWGDYSKKTLWTENSGVCQINLYPLGKPKRRSWPDHYKDLFGFGASDRECYERTVKETRFAAIKEARKSHNPLATICFGKEAWEIHREIFELKSTERQCIGEFEIYKPAGVILTKFFSYGHMSGETAKAVTAVLKGWGIALP